MKLTQSYLNLPDTFFKKVKPTPVAQPRMLLWNEGLAKELTLAQSIDPSETMEDIPWEEYLSGNKQFAYHDKSHEPIAQAYAGHQFGHFTMLGDGRAILLGEHKNAQGENYDIQLKGSGRTPFSRGGDGRATLSSMVREFIISEAMHYLGIPTTRSLAVVFTGEGVAREEMHPGAVLTRVARSHIRVGTFEYAYQMGTPEDVKAYTNYVIERLYPECKNSDNPALALLEMVINRQARLIVDWMRVGFIHGVMNTDNMSISCETIDYGPCAFMNSYDPMTVFSSIDRNGRYAFSNQAPIAHWNLSCFANSLLPVIHEDLEKAIELAKESLGKFAEIFRKEKNSMLGKKIGILNPSTEEIQLVDELLDWMQRNKADYTNTFLALERSLLTEKQQSEGFYENFPDSDLFQDDEFLEWVKKWNSRRSNIGIENEKSLGTMRKVNPSVIPRNHLVEEALESSNLNQWDKIENLWKAIRNPYNRSTVDAYFMTPPKDDDSNYKTFCGT